MEIMGFELRFDSMCFVGRSTWTDGGCGGTGDGPKHSKQKLKKKTLSILFCFFFYLLAFSFARFECFICLSLVLTVTMITQVRQIKRSTNAGHTSIKPALGAYIKIIINNEFVVVGFGCLEYSCLCLRVSQSPIATKKQQP